MTTLALILAAGLACTGDAKDDTAGPGPDGGSSDGGSSDGGSSDGGSDGGSEDLEPLESKGSVKADSCADLLAKDPAAVSGAYELRTSSGGTSRTYCDMDTDGGGWTLTYFSSQDLEDKSRLTDLYAGLPSGDLDDNDAMFAVGEWPSFYQRGAEIRVDWKCVNMGVLAYLSAGPGSLDDGRTTWRDERTFEEVLASDGSFHNLISAFETTGTPCHGGAVRSDFVYGLAFGNGDDYGQYTGWYDQGSLYSTAVSDGDLDNTVGSVAGWIR